MSTETTIFAKIVSGEIPCDKVYEDDKILAFNDISPRYKVHVLVIPKTPHLTGVWDAKNDDIELLGYMLVKTAEIARSLGVDKTGYRIATNNGPDSGHEVPHLHFHILGGEKLNSL